MCEISAKKKPRAVNNNYSTRANEIASSLTDAFAAVQQSESLVAGTDGKPVNFVAIMLAGCLGAYPVRVLLHLALWHLSEPLTTPAD